MTALLMNHTDCRHLALRSRFSVNRPAISLAPTASNSAVALAILGGGSRKKRKIPSTHAVGLRFHKRIGDRVEKGESLATISYNADTRLVDAKTLIAENYFVAQEPPSQKTAADPARTRGLSDRSTFCVED